MINLRVIRMGRFFLCLAFYFCFCNISNGENKAEFSHFILRSDIASMSNSDSLLYYAKKLQASSNQYIHLYGRLGEAKYLYKLKNFDASEQVLNELLEEIESQKRPESFYYIDAMKFRSYEESMVHLKINVYTRLFYIRRSQFRLDEAYEYLMLKDSLFDQLKNSDAYFELGKIKIAREKGLLKREIGSLEESLELMLSLASKIKPLIDSKDDVARGPYLSEYAYILNEIAMSYQRLAKENLVFADSADQFFEKAYRVAIDQNPSVDNVIKHKRSLFINKSNLMRLKEEYKTALAYMDSVVIYGGINKNYLFILKTLCFQGLNRHDSVFFYGKRYLKNDEYPIYKRHIYDALAESYLAVGELDSASKYAELTLETTKKNSKSIQQTFIILNKDAKERHQKIVAAIQAKKQLTMIFLCIVSILLVAVALFFIYYQRRTRKKNRASYRKLYQRYMNLNLKPFGVAVDEKSVQEKSIKETHIADQLTSHLLAGLEEVEQSELYLSKDFNLVHLAKLLKTNTSYLSKIINTEKGKSFNEYLLKLRMDILLRKLEEVPEFRKYTVEALAEFSGYKNASSFSRAFKRYNQTSPYEYIKTTYGN